MDLDAFAALHAAQWQRLETLSKTRRLTGPQTDELVHLYQQVAAQLSQVRSAAPDPALISRLSVILERARTRVTGAIEPNWRDVARFFTDVIPVALYRVRWWALGYAIAFFLVAGLAALWCILHPQVQGAIGTPSELNRLVEQEFANYYSEYPHTSFALGVWTNNAWITALCIALGITGVGPLYILWQNALNLGLNAGVMISHGAADVFFGLIAPHGLLELSCVMVAGGAGLKLFWAWVAPGPLPRARSVAREGRTTFIIAIALAIALAVAGLLEGFVTPSGMPSGLKITIGALAFVAFWLLMWVVGRRRLASGADADVSRAQGQVATAG